MKKGFLLAVIFVFLAFSKGWGQTGNNCLSLWITNQDAVPGSEVCLDVVARHFTGVAGMQFSIIWDSNVLIFSQAANYGLPGLTGANFANNEPGLLTFSWTESQATGASLPDGTVVFSLCFDVIGTAGQESEVRFTDAPVTVEVVSTSPNLVSAALIGGGVFSGDRPEFTEACAGPSSNCASSSGNIEVAVSGGVPPYLFSWNGPDGYSNTAEDLADVSQGVYELTVTDLNGASASGLFILAGSSPMTTSTSLDCEYLTGNPTVANVSTTVWQGGQPPFIFHWNTGESDTTALVSTTSAPLPFTFQVTITDANGCTHIPDPFTPDCDNPVEDLIAGVSYQCTEVVPDSFAVVLTALVWNGAPPFNFTWSTGFSEQTNLTSSITAPVPGEYTVTITDLHGAVFTSGAIEPDCTGFSGDPAFLTIGHENAAADEQICVPVTVANFQSIASLQLTINWNPDQLLLTGIQNAAIPEMGPYSFNFGSAGWQNGQLLMSWVENSTWGITLPDSATLFELCFTATGEGLAPIVFSQSPVAPEAANGSLQLVPLQLADGWVAIDANRVWPGDVDHNGVVNQYDLLPIGLGYGAAGPQRPGATLDWTGQPAQAWPQSTVNSQVNYMHLDADGDGIIGASDTLGLSLNWAQETNFVPGLPDGSVEKPSNLPLASTLITSPIYVEPAPVQAGLPATFKIILGAPEAPGNTVYGLAFSIVYDPDLIVPGSVYATFSNSWIGVQDESMITFYRSDPANNRLHVAMTRIDGQTVTGVGQIGQLHVTIEDVIFKGGTEALVLEVKNALVINNLEEIIPVAENATTSAISGVTGVNDPPLAVRIKAFPMPAGELLHIDSDGIGIEQAFLFDAAGTRIAASFNNHTLDLKGIPKGVYFLRLLTEEGILNLKILKQ